MMMTMTVGHRAEAGMVIRKDIAKRLARVVATMMTTTTAAGRAVGMMITAVLAAVAVAGRATLKAIRKQPDAVGKSGAPHDLAVAPMTTMIAAARGPETTKATAVGLAIPGGMLRPPVADGKNDPPARGGHGRVTITMRGTVDGLVTRADMQKPHAAVGKIVTADR